MLVVYLLIWRSQPMKTLKRRTVLLSVIMAFMLTLSVGIVMIANQTSYAADTYPLLFTRMAGGYNVRLVSGSTETEIEIPEFHNSEGVIEISTSGFASNVYLETVIIPSSVTRVNGTAFFNTPNLRRVHFRTGRDENNNITGVEFIGQMAFGNAPNLDLMIIPSTIAPQNINPMAFFGGTNTRVIYRGEGTLNLTNGATAETDPYGIVYSEVENEDGRKIVVESFQAIVDALQNEANTFGITAFTGEEILDDIRIDLDWLTAETFLIQPFAFANVLRNRIYFADEVADSGFPVLLLPWAFAYTLVNEISLGSFIYIFNDSFDIFRYTTATIINLPGNLTSIPAGTFRNARNLEILTFDGVPNILPTGVTYIGEDAFRNTISLTQITIPATNPFQTMGTSVFYGWDLSQTVYVMYDDVPIAWVANNWLGDGNPNVVTLNPRFTITLNINNDYANVSNFYTIQMLEGSTLYDLRNHEDYIPLHSNKYRFLGWFLENTSVPLSNDFIFDGHTQLFAGWERNWYRITTAEAEIYAIIEIVQTFGVEFNDETGYYYILHGSQLWFNIIEIKPQFSQSVALLNRIDARVNGGSTLGSGMAHIFEGASEPLYITILGLELNAYRVTFNPNGGHVNPIERIFLHGELLVLPTPTRGAGFTFYKWNTNRIGTGSTPESDFRVRGVLTLYAVWRTTIAFNANGGTVDTTPISIIVGANITSLPNAIRAYPFTFYQWNTSRDGIGTSFSIGSRVDSPLVLYALWLVSISLNANGGSVYPSSIQVIADTPVTIHLPTPHRGVGFTFVEWNTVATGAGMSFVRNVTTISSSVTFYAVWQTTITLNPNGGNVSQNLISVIVGTTLAYLPSATRSAGFRFVEWNTNAIGFGDIIAVGHIIDSPKTVFAVWEVTITLNANGGSISPATVFAIQGRTATLLSPSRSGATFVGWNTNNIGTGTAFASGITTITAPVTLFAVWQVAITYDATYGTINPSSTTAIIGRTITLPSATRGGFSGRWMRGTAVHNFGSSFTVAASTHFVATWTENTLEQNRVGTSNEFQIWTPNQFLQLASQPSQGLGRTYRIMRHIDLNIERNFTRFQQFATSIVPVFRGTLEGQDFEIEGFWIMNQFDNYIGLFGQNLGTINRIHTRGVVAGLRVGAGTIAGRNDGVIRNSSVRVPIFSSHVAQGAQYVGGIAGLNFGTIENSIIEREVFILGAVRAIGGIVGSNSGTLRNNTNRGDVNPSWSGIGFSAGGIVGVHVGGSVVNNRHEGRVVRQTFITEEQRRTMQPHLGAIIGWWQGGTHSGNTFAANSVEVSHLVVHTWTTGIWPFRTHHENDQRVFAGNRAVGRTF